jgi:hypothetical protein
MAILCQNNTFGFGTLWDCRFDAGTHLSNPDDRHARLQQPLHYIVGCNITVSRSQNLTRPAMLRSLLTFWPPLIESDQGLDQAC